MKTRSNNKKAYKLYKSGNHKQAEKVLNRSINSSHTSHTIQTDSDLNLLGMIHYQSLRYESAISLFKKAIQLNNQDANYFNNLGAVYKDSNQPNNAILSFKQAIVLNPSFPEALYNLGSTYQLLGDFETAESFLAQSIKFNPDFTVAKNNLACIQLDRGNTGEAIVLFDEIVKQEPLNNAIFSNKLFAMNYLALDQEFMYKSHLEYYDLYKQPITTTTTKRNTHTKLRIGYVSADFRLHSVSYFIYPVIKHHDKSEFDIFCYSDVQSPDTVTNLYSQHSNLKQVYNLSDKQLYDQIQSDEIDILVDLSGHSARNRLQVFIMQAAPIQISYLGYPNTTGIPNIQYRLTDNFVDPSDKYYTEKLIRLNDIFLNYYPGYQPIKILPPPSINNKFITYGSFNNRAKLNSFILDLWASILNSDKTSKLVLKSSINSDEFIQKTIISEFSSRDIDPSRITISPYLDFNNHLNLYQKIDIALDTYPYNGTTTTCEALWAGVPTVSMIGPDHRSRVSADILTSVNLSGCVANTPEEYISKAISLSHNTDFLNIWRAKHKTQMEQSSLMSYAKTTKNIESIYHDIYRLY